MHKNSGTRYHTSSGQRTVPDTASYAFNVQIFFVKNYWNVQCKVNVVRAYQTVLLALFIIRYTIKDYNMINKIYYRQRKFMRYLQSTSLWKTWETIAHPSVKYNCSFIPKDLKIFSAKICLLETNYKWFVYDILSAELRLSDCAHVKEELVVELKSFTKIDLIRKIEMKKQLPPQPP